MFRGFYNANLPKEPSDPDIAVRRNIRPQGRSFGAKRWKSGLTPSLRLTCNMQVNILFSVQPYEVPAIDISRMQIPESQNPFYYKPCKHNQ